MSGPSRKRGASGSHEQWAERRLPKKQRDPQTCEWVAEEPAFRSWKRWDESVAPTLWIHGPAGIGKSFLAQFILDDLAPTEQKSIILGCFCDASSTPSSVLRTLLVQLVTQPDLESDLRDKAATAISDAASTGTQTPFDLSYKLYDPVRTIAGQVPRRTRWGTTTCTQESSTSRPGLPI
jgi:hypothetical protein